MPERLPSFVAVFGENQVLGRAAKAVLLGGTFFGRVLTDSLDFFVVALRKTILRERPPKKAQSLRVNKWGRLHEEVREASRPILENFSYALMMTCVGILIILGVLILAIGRN